MKAVISSARWLRLFIFLLAAARIASAARDIKPGFNLFSRQQDIEMGREASQQVSRQLTLVRDHPELEDYAAGLGQKLAKVSYDPGFPYSFQIVADKNINAFALPGGPIFVNSATIAAADNEAQLAGVLAHEISHVGLRHSTHQATRAFALEIPVVLAEMTLGSGSLLGRLAEAGIGLGMNSVFLKYSRDAEQEADLMGARTMAKAGYDPVEMARFFEKLQKQGGPSGSAAQFFSDHPNPGNRVQYVEEEVRTLPKQNYTLGSSRFSSYRNMAAAIKAGDVPGGRESRSATPPVSGPAGSEPPPRPEMPASDFKELSASGFRISYPSDWQPRTADDGSVTLAPPNGIVMGPSGQSNVALGALAGFFSSSSENLASATGQLLNRLQAGNSGLHVSQDRRENIVIDGSNGLKTGLSGSSPLGDEGERDLLLTVTRPEGLFYIVLVAPSADYPKVKETFDRIQRSIRFR